MRKLATALVAVMMLAVFLPGCGGGTTLTSPGGSGSGPVGNWALGVAYNQNGQPLNSADNGRVELMLLSSEGFKLIPDIGMSGSKGGHWRVEIKSGDLATLAQAQNVSYAVQDFFVDTRSTGTRWVAVNITVTLLRDGVVVKTWTTNGSSLFDVGSSRTVARMNVMNGGADYDIEQVCPNGAGADNCPTPG